MTAARRAIGIRTFLIICMAAALLPLTARRASACSCVAATPEQYAKWADVVFTGVARSAVESEREVATGFAVRVTYKGRPRETRTVRSSTDSASCGYAFREGTKYTVFADRMKNGELWTGLCSGNKRGRIRHEAYGLPPGERA